MPPVTPRRELRQVQAILAQPATLARAIAQQQQGGTSGSIPGGPPDTYSTAPQEATRQGVILPFPLDAQSPNGDQMAGKGHQIFGATGNPVAVLGNLSVTQAGNPYSDRAIALLDADGNVIAWHSPADGPQQVVITNPVTGNYTFSIHDIAKTVEPEGSSASTLTIPTHAASGIPLGAWIEVTWIGTGTPTIATASGVTLLPSGSVGPARQGATIQLRQRFTAADEWLISGEYH